MDVFASMTLLTYESPRVSLRKTAEDGPEVVIRFGNDLYVDLDREAAEFLADALMAVVAEIADRA